jgi:hypothetical protein
MLSDYPDAYATGMAIAERSLRSAIMRETNGVQDYYSLLLENDNFSDVVTDCGVEAIRSQNTAGCYDITTQSLPASLAAKRQLSAAVIKSSKFPL